MAEEIDRAGAVFHLAAAVGVRLIVENPVRTIETNIRGTEIVLELANKKKKRLLIASTSEVYGKNSKVPFQEEDDLVLGSTTRPRWSYACSKAIDEFLALAYYAQHGLPVTIARLFNTVGPRQTGMYGMVIPRFVDQALEGKPITVYGDGTQTRAFCHVSDVVRALTGLLESADAVGRIFNVGSEKETSIRSLAERVVRATGSSSTIQFVPFEEAYGANFEDLDRRVPDTTRLRDLIGFQPEKSLEDIVKDVVEYQRTRKKPVRAAG
jgi:UDP-glucose 4-epimerase